MSDLQLGRFQDVYPIEQKRLRPEGRNWRTEKGVYAPSPSLLISDALELMIEEGYLGLDSLFLDAGGGDGRIAALVGARGMRAVSVEFNPHLSYVAQERMRYLADQGFFPRQVPIVLEGDFLDDSLYAEAGYDFTEFTHVFNYHCNHDDIANKVEARSPKGTKFIFGLDGEPRFFDGFEIISFLRGSVLFEEAPALLGVDDAQYGLVLMEKS